MLRRADLLGRLDDLDTLVPGLLRVAEHLADELVLGLLAVEPQRRLLEAQAARLDEEEVDDEGLDGESYEVGDVGASGAIWVVLKVTSPEMPMLEATRARLAHGVEGEEQLELA